MAKLSLTGGIDLAIESLLSPTERRALILDAAEELMTAAQAEMRAAGGSTANYTLSVNGRPAQNLNQIDPNKGTLLYLFDGSNIIEAVEEVLRIVVSNSPVRSGQYQASHRVFADKQDVTDAMPIAVDKAAKVSEFEIIPLIAYARKVEVWHGVYQGAAVITQRKFGNQAEIGFAFRSPLLSYVPGGANRAERAAIRQQPARIAAMKTERQTRLPCISIKPLGG